MALPALLQNQNVRKFGVPAAAGALGGGLGYLTGQYGGGGLQEFLLGTPDRYEQINRFTPQQQSALSMLLGQGQEMFEDPYADFDDYSQYVQQQFGESIVPQIAAQFQGMTGGAASSPGLKAELGTQGARLAQQLGAQRGEFAQKRRHQALQALAQGITPQYEGIKQPGQPGILGSLLKAATMAASGGLF